MGVLNEMCKSKRPKSKIRIYGVDHIFDEEELGVVVGDYDKFIFVFLKESAIKVLESVQYNMAAIKDGDLHPLDKVQSQDYLLLR